MLNLTWIGDDADRGGKQGQLRCTVVGSSVPVGMKLKEKCIMH